MKLRVTVSLLATLTALACQSDHSRVSDPTTRIPNDTGARIIENARPPEDGRPGALKAGESRMNDCRNQIRTGSSLGTRVMYPGREEYATGGVWTDPQEQDGAS